MRAPNISKMPKGMKDPFTGPSKFIRPIRKGEEVPIIHSRHIKTGGDFSIPRHGNISKIHSGHRVMNPKVVPLAKATPMGINWGAVGKAALHVGKAIYKHPKVQDKWKKFKTKHKLEWLPFGKKPQPRRSVMGRVNKHKYKKGTVQA